MFAQKNIINQCELVELHILILGIRYKKSIVSRYYQFPNTTPQLCIYGILIYQEITWSLPVLPAPNKPLNIPAKSSKKYILPHNYIVCLNAI